MSNATWRCSCSRFLALAAPVIAVGIYAASRRISFKHLAVGAIALLACGQASAQVNPALYYDETIRRGGIVSALSDELFGESISLVDGRVSFRQVDVSLPTNSQLRVEFGRRTPHTDQGREPATTVLGLNWEMDVPFLLSTYDTRRGWVAGATGDQRCSGGSLVPPAHLGPWPYYHTTLVQQHTWWTGIDISLPGEGVRKMLHFVTDDTQVPADGKTYVATASGNMMVSCLDTLKNAPGEGFRLLTSDGREFFFDWMATRNAYDSRDDTSEPLTDYSDGNYDSWHTMTPLTDHFLYATLVKDRFGNFVKYTYDSGRPHRLLSIESNDGVSVALSYAADGLLNSATTNGRRWTYEYGSAPYSLAAPRQLVRVVNPDGSDWKIHITGHPFKGRVDPSFWNSCEMDPGASSASAPDPAASAAISITHPSGALGVFKFRNIVHGKNRSPGGCSIVNSNPDGSVGGTYSHAPYGLPAVYGVKSVYSKTISGPGLSPQQWTYSYFPTWSNDAEWQSAYGLCTSGPCNSTRTRVSAPGGETITYTFGNDYKYNDGHLLKVERAHSGVLYENSTTLFSRVGASNQAFPVSFGEFPTGSCLQMGGYPSTIDRCAPYGNRMSVMNLPVTSQAISRDGVTFSRTFSNFDSRARPTKIIKSSAPTP
ncbi:MAG: hypothetical protein M3Q42_11645 [Pseudomonadota bacterium]|nr:hypothetical protein [Pseudomonadota bacterium]